MYFLNFQHYSMAFWSWYKPSDTMLVEHFQSGPQYSQGRKQTATRASTSLSTRYYTRFDKLELTSYILLGYWQAKMQAPIHRDRHHHSVHIVARGRQRRKSLPH